MYLSLTVVLVLKLYSFPFKNVLKLGGRIFNFCFAHKNTVGFL